MRSDDELWAIVDRAGWLDRAKPEPTDEEIGDIIGGLTREETERLSQLIRDRYARALRISAQSDQLSAGIRDSKGKP
jgi:hypothetical protein